MAYFYRVEAADLGGLTTWDGGAGVSPNDSAAFSNFDSAAYAALVGREFSTIAELYAAVIDCVTVDALAFTTAIEGVPQYWVNGHAVFDQLVALNVDADPDAFWAANGAALDGEYFDDAQWPESHVAAGDYFRVSTFLFIDDETPTNPLTVGTGRSDPTGTPTMLYLVPKFTFVAVEGVAYPDEETFPTPVVPADIGLSTKLVQGPVVEGINRNALLVQDMLEQLVDANMDPDEQPKLVIDLDGHQFLNLPKALFANDLAILGREWEEIAFEDTTLPIIPGQDGQVVTLQRLQKTTDAVQVDITYTAENLIEGTEYTDASRTIDFDADQTEHVENVDIVYATYDSEVLANSPWGYWKFNDDQSTNPSTILDYSGNARHLTTDGANANGDFQPALNVVGELSTECEDEADSASITTGDFDNQEGVTIEGWVRFNSFDDGAGQIRNTIAHIGRSAGGDETCHVWVGPAGNPRITFTAEGAGYYTQEFNLINFTLGEEAYFVCGRAGTSAFFRINDGAVQTATVPEVQGGIVSLTRVEFGADEFVTGRQTNGRISHMAVYRNQTLQGLERYERWKIGRTRGLTLSLSAPYAPRHILGDDARLEFTP